MSSHKKAQKAHKLFCAFCAFYGRKHEAGNREKERELTIARRTS
jgi:hypothetical protein